ncbi:ABC-2 transporter permease [Tissierellaceae bacterium HCP3S3_D8]
MKGLIIKDILNLKRNLKITLLMFIIFSSISYSSGDPSYSIGMISFIFTTMSITSMAYDELVKWDNYALTMPISRKNIVLSKYILSIIFSASSIVISTIISYIFILPKSGMKGSELLLVSYTLFMLSMLFVSIILPLIYKFGVEKSRILMVGVMAVPFAMAFFLKDVGTIMPTESQLMMILKASPLVLITVVLLSSWISCNIYKNKDM